jgi:hypothetical protein
MFDGYVIPKSTMQEYFHLLFVDEEGKPTCHRHMQAYPLCELR